MGYIQGADRNQVILLPDTLDDYVGGDNEVRAIDAFIDSLDIALMGFKAAPAKEGRPGYDPRDMLKLYMYGYLNHIKRWYQHYQKNGFDGLLPSSRSDEGTSRKIHPDLEEQIRYLKTNYPRMSAAAIFRQLSNSVILLI